MTNLELFKYYQKGASVFYPNLNENHSHLAACLVICTVGKTLVWMDRQYWENVQVRVYGGGG